MFGKKKNQNETGLEPGSEAMGPPRLTSIDIQQKEFRLAFRGYREKDVDQFLDQLTEEFTRLSEENKRVRGGAGIPVVAADNGAADDIRRRAQEEAAAILADARARAASIEAQASGVGGAASAAVPNTAGVQVFLTEEREFLHGMAGMIQKHAETIRTTAKSVQQEVAAATAAAAASAPTGAHELSQAEADAVAVFSAPSEQDAPPAEQASDPVEEPAVEEPATEEPAVEEPAVEEPAAEKVQSAWVATASAAPAVLASEPEAAPSADVVSIPPSVIDSPTEVAPEPAMAEEAPQDKRSLRELFWGED